MTAPKAWNVQKEMRAQYFEFSPKVLNSQLTAAFLWVQVRSNSVSGSNPVNSLRDGDNNSLLLRKTVDKNKKKKNGKDGDKKTAWVVVYQISKINRETGRPELVHVS